MGVETRSADGGAGRAGVRAAVLGLGAVAGVALLPAGAAQANVIRTTVSGAAAGTPVEERAVDALLSLSGRTLPLLRQWVDSDPGCGVARALLSLATGDRWDDALLKEQLVMAHRDPLAVGEREASLVYGGVPSHPPAVPADRRSPGGALHPMAGR